MDERRPGIRPRPSLWRRLDAAARRAFPAALAGLALLFLAAPFGLPAQAELQPEILLASTFFWSLYRPQAMPPPVVFLLGLVSDLLSGMPVGVSVIILLLVQGFVFRWRRFLTRQGFAVVWLVFAALAIGSAVLDWALVSALRTTLFPFAPVVIEACLGIGFYPGLALLFIRAHRGPAAPELA
jgi:rod shape-determining protein MreD